jgi:hypothetical protein
MTELHAYCTYFDKGYLSRGLALIQSLRENGDSSDLYVLALDQETQDFLDASGLSGVHTLSIADLEAAESELLPLREVRSRMEYYFTCTPLLIRHVMKELDTPDSVTIYLDGDLYFFDDPSLVVHALGTDSVGIIEHRYPPKVATKLEKYGRFNVGWVGFRDDAKGTVVLDWYCERTLEWCSDTPEDGKYADQGYLNWFPDFSGVRVLESPGFDLAPWNTARHALRTDSSGALAVDGDPLVFFHFHGLRKVGRWFATSQLIYRSPLSDILRRRIYQPYVDVLAQKDSIVLNALGAATGTKKRGSGWKGLVFRGFKAVSDRVTILTRNGLLPSSKS